MAGRRSLRVGFGIALVFALVFAGGPVGAAKGGTKNQF